ncbi:MAG TPA: hypothetical protein VFF54_01305 [Thermodesulfobacteriota bacterium]|nr:hypothetical protein [Thermodesulfobacteriota bacterium]
MKWNIEYSKRANDFIEGHGIRDKVKDSVISFILKITGSNVNVDVKKLKGAWAGYYRIRKGHVRIVLKVDSASRSIFVDIVDFRGSVYR